MCYAPHVVPNISQVDLLLHVVGKIVKRSFMYIKLHLPQL